MVAKGAPVVEGMIIAAMLGLSAGLLLAKNMTEYGEAIFSLMANRTATVAVVCWLWAGAFSGILAASGLVEAMVWLGWKLSLHGAWLTVSVFILAAIFATSVGTGMGTVLGFTAIMYPAGVVLGANPAALMGAIMSGAAFGDNVAPVSDTTIVSAATQETDVGGVVRSRLKYALTAAAISGVLFYFFGAGNASLPVEEAQKLLAETADPKGLPMLIPAAIVFSIAIYGRHFLGALTAGILSAIIIGPVTGIFPLETILRVKDGGVAGSAVDGAMGLVPVSILTLLLVTSIGIMQAGGFLQKLIDWLQKNVARSATGTELSIIGLISITNICVSVNTVAMIAAGPLANMLRKRSKIHSYRSANLLDTVSCSFPYLLPYASAAVAAVSVQKQVAGQYSFVDVLTVADFAPFAFYCVVLYPLMILVAATGLGREYE
jgi:Na+/H+ antiporter NhaC